mmetsp:Transcript_2753/g.5086  ORF Transcript_2753/g.5086 Transcript_2753/m.5086 type:complete len:846 (-) Transcript_2753:628-3165(-)|eukprot:CAMPEP_0197518092 /NCGR_PEP_ID=MMETSP1318-20131121/3210_1 /TAXON_ID=552666 /ORGANISM="Partenskyella glossopodia, Strain RCC365" /LENGTH=845 /DNA_ID=CAMNT_0043068161 /DNA_START=17 /DNA_END=2554 /DNA_ORIENTATION=+
MAAMIFCLFLLATAGESLEEVKIDPRRLAHRFDGVGAISSAGASRLLFDYPESIRMDILDLLFVPQLGASLHHLKVEIGGDTQISCGSEPSHWRTGENEPNFYRGYEFELMKEAKRRNPSIQLHALVFGWPSWIGTSVNPFPQWAWNSTEANSNAAKYVTSWMVGVRDAHNLTIDVVGIWNERSYDVNYIVELRRRLDDAGFQDALITANDYLYEPICSDYANNPVLRDVVDTLSFHYQHSVNDAAEHDLASFGVPLWSTEDYSHFSDSEAAAVWAQYLNANLLQEHFTLTSAWHLIGAFYPSVPFWNRGMILAHTPWSGEYLVQPNLWVTAHTTQFTTPGVMWTLDSQRGSGTFNVGGSYVTFLNPSDLSQMTIVIEKEKYKSEMVTFQLLAGLSKVVKELTVYHSYLTAGYSKMFTNEGKVKVVDGKFNFTVQGSSVYTLTTVPRKRAAPRLTPCIEGTDCVAPSESNSNAFPLPYSDDFSFCKLNGTGRFWSDMSGAFECANSDDRKHGKVLRQSATDLPARGAQNCVSPDLRDVFPFTIIGESTWQFINTSVDFKLDSRGSSLAFLGVRVTARAVFQNTTRPDGIFLLIDHNGNWKITRNVFNPSALIWASGTSLNTRSGWVRVSLSVMEGPEIRFMIQTGNETVQKTVSIYDDSMPESGYVAVGSSWDSVMFDNFDIVKASQASGSGRCDRQFNRPRPGQSAIIVPCGDSSAYLKWNVTDVDDSTVKRIIFQASNLASPMCLGYRVERHKFVVEIQNCSHGNLKQMWTFDGSMFMNVACEKFMTADPGGADFGEIVLTDKATPFRWATPINMIRYKIAPTDNLETPGGTENLCVAICGDE